jgi:hypothetical protein
MDSKQILEHIINNNGECPDNVCHNCPLSRLKKRKNSEDEYMTCVEAIGAHECSEQEANVKYKEIAEKILINETVEEILNTNAKQK